METTKSLTSYAYTITSHDGEEGIIKRIFEVIGASNQWCVELGALDGLHNSNTRELIHEKGWSAVLVEAEKKNTDKLEELYKGVSRVHIVQSFVSFEGASSVDAVFSRTPLPIDFDLFVLDVDGNDYHLWDSLKKYRPRVMCVEFNPTIPNDIDFVQPRDMSIQQGSSLCAIERLGRTKGYRLVATTSMNAFFVREEYFPMFNIEDSSLGALHPDTRFYTRMFQLYDGTIVLSGYKRLLWHKRDFTDKDVQILPSWKRRYPARVEPSAFIREVKGVLRKLPFYPLLIKIKRFIFE